MSHLARFRKGWENEHLALFLLSRISFCANPVTVSDDLGTDLFCCLFEKLDGRTQGMLQPLCSFAIQIKSSQDDFDVTNKLSYLRDLEIPFFVGVVDRDSLGVKIYSGEWLPIFFSECGDPASLVVRLVDHQSTAENHCELTNERKGCLYFPFVTVLKASDGETELNAVTQLMHVLCTRVQKNIAARRSDEHIYMLPDELGAIILTGPGSAKTFRRNFYYRLAESMANLHRLLGQGGATDQLRAEAEAYRAFVRELEYCKVAIPSVVSKFDLELAKVLPNSVGTSRT